MFHLRSATSKKGKLKLQARTCLEPVIKARVRRLATSTEALPQGAVTVSSGAKYQPNPSTTFLERKANFTHTQHFKQSQRANTHNPAFHNPHTWSSVAMAIAVVNVGHGLGQSEVLKTGRGPG